MAKKREEIQERNKRIIEAFLFGGKTLQTIGKEFGMSRERIRQVLEYYGVHGGRLNQRRVKMARLYRFLIEYKMANGGGDPGVREMIDGARLSVYNSLKGTLIDLEEEGLIKLERSGKEGSLRRKYSVSIVGAKWLPPEDWQERFPE